MAQFDESKVINALHPEKAEVGKKYWFSGNIFDLKIYVEENNVDYIGKIIGITKDDYPFHSEDENAWQFLYPYEEQNQRMTRIQFIEWVNKGNGIYKYKNGSSNCYTYVSSLEEELNDEVEEDIVIRTWDSEEWQEPLYSIYKRDVLGEKED